MRLDIGIMLANPLTFAKKSAGRTDSNVMFNPSKWPRLHPLLSSKSDNCLNNRLSVRLMTHVGRSHICCHNFLTFRLFSCAKRSTEEFN